MTTDTKRLRELKEQYWHGVDGKIGLSLDEGIEFRSLILAACDELERLRAVNDIAIRYAGETAVSRGVLRSPAEAQLRTENEKLRAALVQANETAEEFYRASDWAPHPGALRDIETMRHNLKEFIK